MDNGDAIERAVRRALDQDLAGNEVDVSELLRRLIEEVHAARAQSRRPADDAAVDAAVKAAVAAANAAQAAAESATRNSEIIEVFVETLKSSGSFGGREKNSRHRVSRIVTNLQRQNFITHLILGFMVITTAIWRVKEITWILRIRKLLTNPLEGIFGRSDKHRQKDKEEAILKPLQLPQLDLAPLFQKTETAEESDPT